MRRIIFMALIGLVLTVGTSCGNASSSLDQESEKMLRTALTVTSGSEITELKMDKKTLSISYRQPAEVDPSLQLQGWLDMSVVAISFMDEPRTIIIYPTVEGKALSKVTIEGGDVASLLIGEIALEQALSRVRVETPR